MTRVLVRLFNSAPEYHLRPLNISQYNLMVLSLCSSYLALIYLGQLRSPKRAKYISLIVSVDYNIALSSSFNALANLLWTSVFLVMFQCPS